MELLRVSLIQMAAGRNVAANHATAWKHLYGCPESDLIVLPEVFPIRGNTEEQQAAAEVIPGETVDLLATAAKKRGAWVAAGILERDGVRVYNTLVVLDPAGQLAARYRKMHLFELELEDGTAIRESDVYTAGEEPVMVNLKGWRCGLSICYDLRFPELYRYYADYGAQMVLVPSNFTRETGEAHWEALLRARAIENQCYVLAPNQCGVHPESGVPSLGRTLAVDPWGRVVGEAAEGENVLHVTLDPAVVDVARTRLPALKHRRMR